MTALDQDIDAAPAEEAPLFDAVLRPHRSLSETGFLILMLCVGAVSFLSGMAFLLMGAWPVMGFFGLDAALIYLAFRLNYRSGRLYERVRLTPRTLEVERITARGRRRLWEFQPYWLRVELYRAEHPDCRLMLTSHGRSLEIGAFLSPEERVSLHHALRAAVARCRCAPAPVG